MSAKTETSGSPAKTSMSSCFVMRRAFENSAILSNSESRYDSEICCIIETALTKYS